MLSRSRSSLLRFLHSRTNLWRPSFFSWIQDWLIFWEDEPISLLFLYKWVRLWLTWVILSILDLFQQLFGYHYLFIISIFILSKFSFSCLSNFINHKLLVDCDKGLEHEVALRKLTWFIIWKISKIVWCFLDVTPKTLHI